MIYDTDLDVTWLQDASYARTSGFDADGFMSWDDAQAYVASLVYQGFDDWRLPSARDYLDGTLPPAGNHVTQSEMGHLYFIELGNAQGGPMNNIGPFVNVENTSFPGPDRYWLAEEDENNPGLAYIFRMSNSYQGVDAKGSQFSVWPVRDGMAPEPGTLVLMTLVAAAVARRSRPQNKDRRM